MAVNPTSKNASFAHLQATGPSQRTAWASVNLGTTDLPAVGGLNLGSGAEGSNALAHPAGSDLDLGWRLSTDDGDLLSSSAPVGMGIFLFRDNTDGGGTGSGSVTFIELRDEASLSFPTGGPTSQASGTSTIPGANLVQPGTYKVVVVMYDQDGDTPPSTGNIDNAGEFYVDADNNVLDQSNITTQPALNSFTVGRVGWIRVGATPQSLTTSISPNQRYAHQPTVTVDVDDGTLNNPKAVRVGPIQPAAANGDAPVKSRSITVAANGSGTSSSYPVDSQFPAAQTAHHLRLAVGPTFGQTSTPAGEIPDLLATGTLVIPDTNDKAWVVWEVAGTGLTKKSNYLVESDTELTITSEIVVYETSGLVTEGAKTFETSAYAVERDVFRRRGPTITQQATPHFEGYVVDGFGNFLEGISFQVQTRRHSDSASENTQTIVSGSGGTAGRLRWNYTVLNTHTAFNRFKKNASDNPRTPPASRDSSTITTLTANVSTGANVVMVADASAFSAGDIIVIDRGGAAQEIVVLFDVDYQADTLTTVGTVTVSHLSGEGIRKVHPIYPKAVYVRGNAFAGTNEPEQQSLNQIGVNSELHVESIWTGDVTDATIDASGTPTGRSKLSKQSGAGTVQFKLATAIDRSTGLLVDVAEHNVKTVDGASVVVTTDKISQRKAIWNQTAAAVELSPTNSNITLDQSDAYALSPNNGFEAYDVTGDSRLVDLAMGFADTTTQRGTFDLTSQPGGLAAWNKGQEPNTSMGFTADVGNYGAYVIRLSFFILDASLFLMVALTENTIPPGGIPHLSIQVNRRAPDGSITPAKADDDLSVYIAKDGGAGVGLIDLVINDHTTPINPDGEGKSANHEYTPPVSVRANGTYAVEVHGASGGSPILARGTTTYRIGDPDPRYSLAADMGHADLAANGRHLQDGDDVEFGCNLIDADGSDFVDIDDDGTAVVVITRAVGSGAEEYFDSDETWKPAGGTIPYKWPLTVAGDLKSARLVINNMDLDVGDIVGAFFVRSGGAPYAARVPREVTGTKFQHNSTDESTIPFDKVSGHHHTSAEVAAGDSVGADSRAIGDRGLP